jgi:hypothetical protein
MFYRNSRVFPTLPPALVFIQSMRNIKRQLAETSCYPVGSPPLRVPTQVTMA